MSVASADGLVGGALLGPPGVSHHGFSNTRDLVKDLLGTPESAEGKRGYDGAPLGVFLAQRHAGGPCSGGTKNS
eukprot:CAMPEP_0204404840 /NCGR_PEP_ID=MMETSP0470-20130426/6932_1 /ASSEMBLY_ACC=CAM_ASM_000385 /TAXON_ID=2969 /ORGANISM="Oxyrrhis marina" /LENGTH=73 /DNA_ID=CAMNT_0051400193 /DNA_START=355 /DNA_END=576 /DNA_ORIENTATION=+